MRIATLFAAGVLGSALVAMPAGAMSVPVPAAQQLMQTVQACPPGYRYIPPGYAKHAKYRPGQCVRR